MTKAEIALKLDNAKTALHVEAIDNGHDPQVWIDDETYRAHTACRKCGRTLVVRVYSDRVWTSGLSGPCEAAVKS